MLDFESTDLASAAHLAELAGEADDWPDYEPSAAELADKAAELSAEGWTDAILIEVQSCPACADSDPLCDYCHPF